jgi:histone deacetylase complex regulatory component SIN3
MSSTSNSKLNKKTSSIKKTTINKSLKKQQMFFLRMIWSKKRLKIHFQIIRWNDRLNCKKTIFVSIFIIETKLFSMLHVDKKLIWWIHFFQKLKFNLNQKIMIYNDNLQIIRFFISKILKIETKLRHVDIAQCWLR